MQLHHLGFPCRRRAFNIQKTQKTMRLHHLGLPSMSSCNAVVSCAAYRVSENDKRQIIDYAIEYLLIGTSECEREI